MAVPQQLLPTLMPLYSFKPYRWTIVQPQLDPWPISRQKGNIPIPRSGHRMIYFEGHLYSFGGFNPKLINGEFSNDEESDSSEYYPLFMELWQFNTATRRWRKIPITGEVPEQLASHTALFVTRPKRKLLVYGGTGMPFGQTASNMVYLCDLSNSYTWEKVVVTKNELAPTVGNHFPKKLYGQAITLSENGRFLYTIGGTSGFQYFMDVHRLDMETNTWEQLHAGAVDDAHIMDHAINMSPTPRYRHELVYYKGAVYVLGGGTSMDSDGFDTIFSFDEDRKEWRKHVTHGDPTVPIDNSIQDQYPTARRCHSVVQEGRFIYLMGGYDGTEIFPGFWRLDLDSLDWRKMVQDIPEPVYFHDSTISPEGKVYMFGGVENIDDNGNSRSNTVQSCWVKIPSLRTICWEALSHYHPDLEKRPVNKLLEEGIPPDLVRQLHADEANVAA